MPRNESKRGAASNELLIYGDIGFSWFDDGVLATDVAAFLRDFRGGDEVVVRINSYGGDAFEGIAIHNLLRSHAATIKVVIDGAAISSASIIAMAGDTIHIAENAMMMVHDPWSFCAGNSSDMRSNADRLDKIAAALATSYVSQTGKTEEAIRQIMSDETWMTAAEALELGFVDTIDRAEEEPAEDVSIAAMAAHRFAASWRHPPERMRQMLASAKDKPKANVAPPAEERGATKEDTMDLKEVQAALDKANQELGAVKASASDATAKLEKSEAEKNAIKAELDTSKAAVAAHETQNAALSAQRDEALGKLAALEASAAAEAKVANAKILAAEVDALVGVKIDPSERDTFLELASENRPLFDKFVNQRATKTLLQADPAGLGPDPKPAPLGAVDNGEGLAKRIKARAS